MAQLTEYVDELIREVGPRPAGTQQEHQAAELIAARLDSFGMQVDIEEFSCSRNLGWVRVLYYALSVIGAAVTIFLPDFYVWGIVLAIAGVVFMLLDYVDKNPLFTVFKNSLSQNVIARHLPPGADPQSRSRKVVILVNYDSARRRVQAAPPLVGHYVLLRRIIRVVMVVLVVLMLLTLIPFLGFMRTVLTVPINIAGGVVLLALIVEVVNLFLPWNQGVNCNGSGIGVLYGLAEMFSSGVDRATSVVAARGSRRRAATDGSGGVSGGGATKRASRGERAGRGARGGRSGRTGAGDGAGAGAGARGAAGRRAGAGVGVGAAGAGAAVGGAAAGGAADTAGAVEPLDSRVSLRGTSRRAEPTGAAGVGAVDQSGGFTQAGGSGQSGRFAQVQTIGLAQAAQDTQDIGRSTQTGVSTPESRGMASSQGGIVQTLLDDSSVQAVGESFAQPVQPVQLGQSGQPVWQRQPGQPPASGLQGAGVPSPQEAQSQPQSPSGGTTATAAAQRVPAWFANAKKNAERKQQQGTDDPGIVRSRFADVPTSGRVERTDDGHGNQPGEQAEVPYGAQQAAQHGTQQAAQGQPEAPLGAHAQPESKPLAHAHAQAQHGTHAPAHAAAQASQQDAAHASSASVGQLAAQAGERTIAPVTAQPDFSGLDRQAFKVLPGDENRDGSVIVPEAQPAAGPDIPVLVTPVATPRTHEIPAMLAAVQPGEQDAQTLAEDSLALAAPTPSPTFDSASAPVLGSGEPSAAQLKLRNRLRGLPTVSAESTGNFPAYQANLDTQLVAKEELFSSDNSMVSATGAFVPLGTTGVMKPISDELLAYHKEGEIYIHDADDTSITERYSQTGEYSKPELVDIPDSRMKSFFGSMGERLTGKKRERLDNSPSSWLGVDERFDARKEGNDIGSWDNFHEDDGEWKGGAFGGENFEANVDAMVRLSSELLDKEVWLVALGASESKNEGLHNLIANHGSELKNALFINLLGVGMGDLVFTISEGDYRPVLTDHRMQSLIASAAENMAIPLGPVRFPLFTTDGTVALRKGSRAISIMGLGNQAPVGWRWVDDDVSRLREDNLLDVMAVISETIKNS